LRQKSTSRKRGVERKGGNKITKRETWREKKEGGRERNTTGREGREREIKRSIQKRSTTESPFKTRTISCFLLRVSHFVYKEAENGPI
jgi:hypothetical protein